MKRRAVGQSATVDKGGQYAAWEQPQLFSQSARWL